MSKTTLVFAAPVTPIADLHLGHLAGPYIGADAFSRYQRMKGQDVTFIASTRDHDARVERRAESLGVVPSEVVAAFSGRMRQNLEAAGIEPDVFLTPTLTRTYSTSVGSFFTDLWKRGHLSIKEAPVFFCPSCRRDPGPNASGVCPRCDGECRGNICRMCGHPALPGEVREPVCGHCSGSLEVKQARRLVFDLNQFRARLLEYHSSPRLRLRPQQLVNQILAAGLGEFPLDKPGSWGVEIPLANLESFRLDIAGELAAFYLGAVDATQPSKERSLGRSYPSEDDVEIIQFLGVDDIFAHAILQPALLMAAEVGCLPARFVVNEFYLLDSMKFSSSVPHAIWAGDFLARVPTDLARYHLCFSRPEVRHENFTTAAFQQKINHKLVEEIGERLETVLRALSSYRPQPRPQPEDSPNGGATAFNIATEGLVAKVARAASGMGRFLEADNFSLYKAGHIWRDMVLCLGSCFPETAGDKEVTGSPRAWDEAATAITLVASCAYPLMPQFASRLWDILGIDKPLATHPWGQPVPSSAARTYPPLEEPLFASIQDHQWNEKRPSP